MRSTNGPIILVLGILSWTGCSVLTGIPAWLMGNAALDDIQRGRGNPSEQGIVQAGRLLGMISTVLTLLAAVLAVLFFAGMRASMPMPSGFGP